MAYGEHTKVPFDRTVTEIIAMLRKAGAMQVGHAQEPNRLTVLFAMADRQVRFRVSWDSERSQRQRARALMLVIKAKLESVESEVETFEEAFLANVVTMGGSTVYERVREPIAIEYQTGKPAMMLEGPKA